MSEQRPLPDDDSPPPPDPYFRGDTPPTAPLARPVAAAGAVLDRLDPMLLLASSTRLASLADLGIIVALMLVFEFVGAALLSLASGIPMSMLGEVDAQRALLIPLLLTRFVSCLICVFFVLRLRKQSPASVGLVRSKMGMNLLIGVGAMMVAYAIILPTMIALTMASPRMFEQMQENREILTALLSGGHPLALVGAMAAVGVWEELFFRGFLMTRLRRVTGAWIPAVLLSSVVFVLPHALTQAPAAMVMIAILSLVMSVVTIWRRSLVPAIVAHALFNITQVAGLFWDPLQ